jgi:hypothetical protein
VWVWPAHRWENGVPADAIPDAETAARWLLVEWRKDGTIKDALSNLPSDTTLQRAVALWKERWQVERGYEQLKGELELDHFEGRSWQGFHHHAAMTFLAYGFLALERQRALTAAVPSDREARCGACPYPACAAPSSDSSPRPAASRAPPAPSTPAAVTPSECGRQLRTSCSGEPDVPG